MLLGLGTPEALREQDQQGRAYGKAHRGAGVGQSVTGIWVLLAAVAVTVAVGLLLRARNGTIRDTAPDDNLREVLAALDAAPGWPRRSSRTSPPAPG